MTGDAVGGVWTYALELADALEPHGTEVVLATMGPAPSRAQEEELARSAIEDLRVSSFALEWTDEPWTDVAAAGAWLLDLADELDPDLVHLNGYAHGALPWPCPVLIAGHSCVLSWWRAVRGGEPPPRLNPYRDAIRRGLAGADLLVTPTRALLTELEGLYGPRCARRVIPNGRRPVVAREKEPYVLAAARAWDEAKNLTTLDHAAPATPWPVLVAGDGGERLANVQPLGRVERTQLDDLLGRATIYAAPALYEPFGLGALEAATAGCALVLGDIPSLREVWAEAAAFVEPRDADALAAALTELAEDEPRRAALAARAQDRARLYAPERMAASYVDAYRHLTATAAVEATA
ncbi:MAG: glycosyltransferase family 4 protein [Actinomycetota bacterium]|nr:glycosyltransferase family 4 protein [Actinomycetota bacterium]